MRNQMSSFDRLLPPLEPVQILTTVENESLPVIRYLRAKSDDRRASQHREKVSLGLLLDPQGAAPAFKLRPIIAIFLAHNQRAQFVHSVHE